MAKHTNRGWYDRGQDPGARIEKTCKGCGKKFVNTKRESPANWKRKKYCSLECYLKYSNHPTSGPRWTVTQQIILYEAYKAGGSPLAAKILGRSQSAVKKRVELLKITPKNGKKFEMARRKANGFVFFQIAEDDGSCIDPREIEARISAVREAKISRLGLSP